MAAERPDKKEKKEKKEKRSEEAGVSKPKKDKKERRGKKEKLAAAVEGTLQDVVAAAPPPQAKAADDGDDDTDMEGREDASPLERTVVPFAVPVADEKGMKKVYKTIRKAAKNGTLKRGVKEVVKEVVKALRKSPASAPGYTSFPGLVVIAGDISPADVISHLPVLCEDHNVPFIFVTSRAELGAAAKTKRPTSVVMITEKHDAAGAKKKQQQAKDADKSKDAEGDGEEAFAESYASLVKYVQKEYARQGFWAKGESKA